MAEIPRFLVTQQAPRAAPGRSARQVAPLRAPAPAEFAQEGRAVAGLGGAIAQIGSIIDQIDQRFAAAKASIESEQGITALDQNILDVTQAQDQQQFIDVQAAQTAMTTQRDTLAATMSTQGKARFLARSNQRIEQAVRGLAHRSRAQTSQQIKASYARDEDRYAMDMANLETDAERQERTEIFRAESLVDYVRTGGKTRHDIEETIETVGNQLLARDIQRDPQGMLNKLEDPEQFRHLDAQERVQAIALAEKTLDDVLRRNNARERADLENRKAVSAQERTQTVIDMLAVQQDPDAVAALAAQTEEQFRQGLLLSSDAEYLANYADRLQTQGENEARNTTTAEALKDYYRLLFVMEDPQEAMNYAIDSTGQGIAVGAVGGLVSTAQQAREANHFRNLPEVKDAVAFVEDQLSSTGDPMLDSLVSVQVRGIQADARLDLMLQVAAVAGPDGLNKDDVKQTVAALRDSVVQTHRTRLLKLVETGGQEAVRGQPQTNSIRAACNRWQFMQQQGVPKYEADAFLGRELARHIARDTPAEQSMNTQAAITELAGCLQGAGQ